MTEQLILNGITGKTHIGYLPRQCSFNFKKGDFLRAFYINAVKADIENQQLEVEYTEVEVYAPNVEFIHEVPFPFTGKAVTNQKAVPYRLNGIHPSGHTWFKIFCMILSGEANREIGDVFWKNSMNGMLHKLAYEILFPGLLNIAVEKVMPYQPDGSFVQPVIFRHAITPGQEEIPAELDDQGNEITPMVPAQPAKLTLTDILGSLPFTYSVNGQAVVDGEIEIDETIENVIVATDSLGNTHEITLTAIPEEQPA